LKAETLCLMATPNVDAACAAASWRFPTISTALRFKSMQSRNR